MPAVKQALASSGVMPWPALATVTTTRAPSPSVLPARTSTTLPLDLNLTALVIRFWQISANFLRSPTTRAGRAAASGMPRGCHSIDASPDSLVGCAARHMLTTPSMTWPGEKMEVSSARSPVSSSRVEMIPPTMSSSRLAPRSMPLSSSAAPSAPGAAGPAVSWAASAAASRMQGRVRSTCSDTTTVFTGSRSSCDTARSNARMPSCTLTGRLLVRHTVYSMFPRYIPAVRHHRISPRPWWANRMSRRWVLLAASRAWRKPARSSGWHSSSRGFPNTLAGCMPNTHARDGDTYCSQVHMPLPSSDSCTRQMAKMSAQLRARHSNMCLVRCTCCSSRRPGSSGTRLGGARRSSSRMLAGFSGTSCAAAPAVCKSFSSMAAWTSMWRANAVLLSSVG